MKLFLTNLLPLLRPKLQPIPGDLVWVDQQGALVDCDLV